MIEIYSEKISANDEEVRINHIASSKSFVAKGDIIAEVEGDKAVSEIVAPAGGFFHTRILAGQKVATGELIGVITESAEFSWVDVDKISGKKLSAEKELLSAAKLTSVMSVQPKSIGGRIAVVGAGRGLSQVLEILSAGDSWTFVGSYDDVLWNGGETKRRHGKPVLGPVNADVIQSDFEKGVFSAIIVSVSTSIDFRNKIFNDLVDLGVELPSIHHPSATIDKRASVGGGNIILPNVHVGPYAAIGDNNFISAFSNIEHHCRIGNCNTFGPAVMLSGSVAIGSGNRFGTGIFIEPKLTIGDNCVIASGSVITTDVSSGTTLKRTLR